MSIFPVINSTLSESALLDYLRKRYTLTSGASCKLFRAAMNHIYIICDREKKYIFRVYTYNWRTKQEISEELRLLNFLKVNQNAVAFPISDKFNTSIHEFDAPEGKRFGVLFSYAKGKKIAKFSVDASYNIGAVLANIHRSTTNFKIDRVTYDTKILLDESLLMIKQIFSGDLTEIQFLERLASLLKDKIDNGDRRLVRVGAVHLDVWFDNLHINDQGKITIFDFDFCGNGMLCLDISYFLYQLFSTNPDEKEYKIKADSFIRGYLEVSAISDGEKALLPYACLSIMIYYIGIQCDRFTYWTNIFVNEDHLKRTVGGLNRWIKFHGIQLE